MDRNDDDEYAEPDGVDPEWNPFSTPRSLDDGPGWDDGSPHAGGVSRMPKRLIVVITIVTLIVAVVSIGLVVTESNMSVHRTSSLPRARPRSRRWARRVSGWMVRWPNGSGPSTCRR